MSQFLKFFLISAFIIFCIGFNVQGDEVTKQETSEQRALAEQLYTQAMQLYDEGDLDESLKISKLAIDACQEVGLLDGVAQLLLNKGIIYRIYGDYPQSLKYLYMSLEHFQTLMIKSGEASSLNQIGSIYRIQGNYSGALEHLLQSLRLFEEINDSLGTASALNNIGIVYFYQNNFEKSLEYYLSSLDIELELGSEYGVSISYINIGEVYKKLGKYQEALDYFLKALVLARKHEAADKDGDSVGVLYNEIGSIYTEMGNFILSLSYLNRAHTIFKQLGNRQRLAESRYYFGELALKQNNYSQAKTHFLEALNYAQAISALDIIADANHQLSKIFELEGNIPQAYNHYKKYITYRDSIFNEDNMKRMVQAEMLYQFEREMHDAKVEQAKRDVKALEESRRQKLLRNFLILLLVMLLIVVGAVYRSYQNKQKANIELARQQNQILEKNEELIQQQEEILSQRDEIEKKNQLLEIHQQLIEAKNERIISSIEYAQTIQQAILPKKEHLNKYFPDHMVIFLPKDIVSGDFYWFSSMDNLLFAAVVDCTGHGVPGAFMSLIGNTLLNQIVNEWQTRDPAIILELMHKQVRRVLNQDESTGKAHASMDICMVSVDTKKKRGTFAGASRPLYIVRNGELEKISGDPRSVGGYQREERRFFTNHDIDLSKATNLFLTTDGYVDQMNGAFKKFGHKLFTQLLVDLYNEPSDVQSSLLLAALEHHQQGHEQIDDICILGLKF